MLGHAVLHHWHGLTLKKALEKIRKRKRHYIAIMNGQKNANSRSLCFDLLLTNYNLLI